MKKFAYLRNIIVNVNEIETISDSSTGGAIVTFRSGRVFIIDVECYTYLLKTMNEEENPTKEKLNE